MNQVLLATIVDAPAAQPVLDVATHLAPFIAADVVAVHVRQRGHGVTARKLAEAAEVPFLVRGTDDGNIVAEIAAAHHELHARAIVAGAGAVARLVHAQQIAVVVVPANAAVRPLARVLVCVQGDREHDALVAIVDRPANLPLFRDPPRIAPEAWAHEMVRHVMRAPDGDTNVHVRLGNVADVVPDSSRDLGVDFVVIAGHGALSNQHVDEFDRLLEGATVPVLLLPISPGTELANLTRADQVSS